MSTEKDTTKVDIIEGDLEAILNLGGAANIMLPTEKDKKTNLFSRKSEDLSFIDKPDDSGNEEKNEKEDEEKNPPIIDKTALDKMLNPSDDDEDEFTSNNKGRPKLSKDVMLQVANKLIEKKVLVPFDDDKPLEEYTVQDFEELFEANIQEKEKKISQEVPKKFLESLPPELQYAAEYVYNGGQDLKSLFRSLAAVEEVRQMDPKDENDARTIVRSYLQATNFGTPEEIEEEINAWEDRGELSSKAQKFKPKLDAMTEKQVQYQIAQQEQMRKQQEEQARMYMDSVYKTLEPGELNGLKLDKKMQNLLFSGLVQPNYPSVSGRPTNLLGHLLEKYQYVEPNHALIAEALWLLADPEGYRNKVRENTKKEVVADTVRQLKSEESRRLATSTTTDDDNQTKKGEYRIPRPNKNFFKR